MVNCLLVKLAVGETLSAFPQQFGPQILLLESNDYFGTSEYFIG